MIHVYYVVFRFLNTCTYYLNVLPNSWFSNSRQHYVFVPIFLPCHCGWQAFECKDMVHKRTRLDKVPVAFLGQYLLNTLLCLGTLLCVYLVMVIYGYIAAVSVRTMLTSACVFVLVLTWYYSRFWPKARLETLTNARGT